jgi:hypothetical protein
VQPALRNPRARPDAVAQAINLRGADSQPVGAQDPDGDAEQEQQLEGAAAAFGVGLEPDRVSGCRGIGAGELAVGAEPQSVAAVGEVRERVEALEQRRGGGRLCGCRHTGFLGGWRLAAAASQLGLVSWVLPLDLWITLWTAPLSRRCPLGVRW